MRDFKHIFFEGDEQVTIVVEWFVDTLLLCYLSNLRKRLSEHQSELLKVSHDQEVVDPGGDLSDPGVK